MWAALKWGVLVGVGIYVLDRLALTWLATALFGPGVPSLDNPALFSSLCLGIFALLFAFSAAGYFAGRETARPGMGVTRPTLPRGSARTGTTRRAPDQHGCLPAGERRLGIVQCGWPGESRIL